MHVVHTGARIEMVHLAVNSPIDLPLVKGVAV